jgi:hypothetical protein
LLPKDNEADVAPLDWGVKVTVKAADCPTARVTGSEIPETANSLLFRLADVMFTAEPLALRDPVNALLDPTVTFPKLRLPGDTVKVPEAPPVPESAMFSGEFFAFDTIEMLPLAEPPPVGENVAVKVTLWFAVRLIGRVNPVIENPPPETFACEMVTVDEPLLVKVSDKLVVLPTCTVPKARLEGFAASVPA